MKNPWNSDLRRLLPRNPDTALPSGISWTPPGPSDPPSPCSRTRKKQQISSAGFYWLGWYQLKTYEINLLSLSCLLKGKETHLLFQPVVILDDACHHHVGTLHVEGDFSSGFILEKKGWFNSAWQINQEVPDSNCAHDSARKHSCFVAIWAACCACVSSCDLFNCLLFSVA